MEKNLHIKASEGLTCENLSIYSSMLEKVFRSTEEKGLIGALVGVLNEIGAKENGMTITEWYDKMSKTAIKVQEQLGEYEYETETIHSEECCPFHSVLKFNK